MKTEINLKAISTLVAICGLIFGIVKFIHVQEIEAAKPYLEKKLQWCEEAVETASSIANNDQPDSAKLQRFWQLYWGVMGLIEKKEIETAMICFGNNLKPDKRFDVLCNKQVSDKTLKGRALDIAKACRSELANDWSSSWLL